MYRLLALAPLLISSTVYATQITNHLCDVSSATIDIPSGQTNLTLPSGIKPKFIAVGLGTQNYTCSSSGTYTNVGALAELLDISCLVSDQAFASVRKRAPFPDSDGVWEHEAQVRALLGPGRLRLGIHYFEQNPTGAAGLTPVFDFRGDLLKNDSQAFVAVNKIGDLLAPTNSTQDVDWLGLSGFQGDAASFVFRVDTHFGQPPKTCQPGSAPIQVRYSAKYWFFQNTTSATATASGSNNYGNLNAALSTDLNSSDAANLQKLLNYAPAVMGLLAVTTILSLAAVVFGIMSFCRRRRSSVLTRSAPAYHPVQLSRAKQPMEESYHDEAEPYGA